MIDDVDECSDLIECRCDATANERPRLPKTRVDVAQLPSWGLTPAPVHARRIPAFHAPLSERDDVDL